MKLRNVRQRQCDRYLRRIEAYAIKHDNNSLIITPSIEAHVLGVLRRMPDGRIKRFPVSTRAYKRMEESGLGGGMWQAEDYVEVFRPGGDV